MQVSVANTQGLERQMTVVLPAQELETEVAKRLTRLRKTVKLPGFRPGKIPNKVLESNFGSEVLNEVANEKINSSYVQALQDQKLEPATRPVIEPVQIQRGEDLIFKAVFDVFPEGLRTDLDSVSIESATCELTDSDVDETIDTIRQQRVNWIDTDQPAQEKDRIIINFKGILNGEPFEGGEAQDYPVIIGDGQLLEGFETGLIGMNAGDSKRIDLDFPENYTNKKLAGESVIFEISAVSVSAPELPEIDEQFIKSLGIGDGTIASMREQVKENMQREVNKRIQSNLNEQVLKALVEINEVDLPVQLIEDEVQYIRQANLEQMKKQGITTDPLANQEEKTKQEAMRRVKLSILMREVIIKYDIKLEKALLNHTLDEMAESYDDKGAYRNWYLKDKQRLKQLESLVLEKQVVDKLVATANLTKKSVPFKVLMDMNQA